MPILYRGLYGNCFVGGLFDLHLIKTNYNHLAAVFTKEKLREEESRDTHKFVRSGENIIVLF